MNVNNERNGQKKNYACVVVHSTNPLLRMISTKVPQVEIVSYGRIVFSALPFLLKGEKRYYLHGKGPRDQYRPQV